jgi:hypothetical protein
MSRTLKIISCLSLLVVVGAAGYWFGGQRSADVYGHAYINDAVERELFEARHDLTLVEALAENKVEATRKLCSKLIPSSSPLKVSRKNGLACANRHNETQTREVSDAGLQYRTPRLSVESSRHWRHLSGKVGTTHICCCPNPLLQLCMRCFIWGTTSCITRRFPCAQHQ